MVISTDRIDHDAAPQTSNAMPAIATLAAQE
jgi:hypothetical protein